MRVTSGLSIGIFGLVCIITEAGDSDLLKARRGSISKAVVAATQSALAQSCKERPSRRMKGLSGCGGVGGGMNQRT